MVPNPPRQPNSHHETLQHAAFALQSQRPSDAEKLAAEVLKTHPHDSGALQIFGYALQAQKRGREAIPVLEPGARATRDPVVETLLGMLLRQSGRDDEAETWLKRAAKREPAYPPAFLELGGLLMMLGRTDEAIATFDRGLQAAPDFAELALQLGGALTERNDLARARDAFAGALRSAPNNPAAVFGLARATELGGAYMQAIDIYRSLLATPHAAMARVGVGSCQLALGQTDAALESFRAAARGGSKYYGMALMALAASDHRRCARSQCAGRQEIERFSACWHGSPAGKCRARGPSRPSAR